MAKTSKKKRNKPKKVEGKKTRIQTSKMKKQKLKIRTKVKERKKLLDKERADSLRARLHDEEGAEVKREIERKISELGEVDTKRARKQATVYRKMLATNKSPN